jgi:hypothetical protein
MNILFVYCFNQALVKKNVNIIPRIGESVDMFCYPYPKINGVLWYPSSETIKGLVPTATDNIDIVIFVE